MAWIHIPKHQGLLGVLFVSIAFLSFQNCGGKFSSKFSQTTTGSANQQGAVSCTEGDSVSGYSVSIATLTYVAGTGTSTGNVCGSPTTSTCVAGVWSGPSKLVSSCTQYCEDSRFSSGNPVIQGTTIVTYSATNLPNATACSQAIINSICDATTGRFLSTNYSNQSVPGPGPDQNCTVNGNLCSTPSSTFEMPNAFSQGAQVSGYISSQAIIPATCQSTTATCNLNTNGSGYWDLPTNPTATSDTYLYPSCAEACLDTNSGLVVRTGGPSSPFYPASYATKTSPICQTTTAVCNNSVAGTNGWSQPLGPVSCLNFPSISSLSASVNAGAATSGLDPSSNTPPTIKVMQGDSVTASWQATVASGTVKLNIISGTTTTNLSTAASDSALNISSQLGAAGTYQLQLVAANAAGSLISQINFQVSASSSSSSLSSSTSSSSSSSVSSSTTSSASSHSSSSISLSSSSAGNSSVVSANAHTPPYVNGCTSCHGIGGSYKDDLTPVTGVWMTEPWVTAFGANASSSLSYAKGAVYSYTYPTYNPTPVMNNFVPGSATTLGVGGAPGAFDHNFQNLQVAGMTALPDCVTCHAQTDLAVSQVGVSWKGGFVSHPASGTSPPYMSCSPCHGNISNDGYNTHATLSILPNAAGESVSTCLACHAYTQPVPNGVLTIKSLVTTTFIYANPPNYAGSDPNGC